jgi:PAS domain S-box-containing protein
MIKITVVVPYKELGDSFIETFNNNEYAHKPEYEANEYELDIVVATSADEVSRLKLDSDLIVARGATAYALRDNNYYIPVVEIPVSAHDLTRALHEGKIRSGGKKLAVVGSINMTLGAEKMSDIIGVEIKPYIYSDNNEIKSFVSKAKHDGFEVIIGGVYTCECAQEQGFETVFLKTGRESVIYALEEAKRVASISRREQEKALRFKTILDYAYEGVIAVDDKNIISVFNSSAAKTLGIDANRAVGFNFNEVMPKSLIKVLSQENEYLDEVIQHNDIHLAMNKVPIILKSEKLGIVYAFQDVTNIQEMESKIRKKIYTRGHVAKHNFNNIIGGSKKLTNVIEIAKRFSKVDSNILLFGETGTGKELFAQSIHNYSSRSKGPFVAVNCAALPESLLESELFGYVDGAFTGAAKGGKPGLFELAHTGTIFLDEISEISQKIQGRLLRVLQEKEIMRLGHDRVIPVDIRVVSASNKDLYNLVQKGEFREDLYYRLDILKIDLPTLRERYEDILILIDYFMDEYCKQIKKGSITITTKAREKLMTYSWPGNTRELQNVCERLAVLNQGGIIREEDVVAVLPCRDAITVQQDYNIESFNIKLDYNQKVEELQKDKIRAVLKEVQYSKSKAAENLGISRTTLWRRMKELGIS